MIADPIRHTLRVLVPLLVTEVLRVRTIRAQVLVLEAAEEVLEEEVALVVGKDST